MPALSASLSRSQAVLFAQTNSSLTLQRSIAKAHQFTPLTLPISTTGRFPVTCPKRTCMAEKAKNASEIVN
ncbi:hypothetical protein [Paraburkholderia sp. PGU19]|uniref:hypothetical protein n=1 Tax=Paraburkholderia sp. PGU19 TaxID=2735434 RepID=UPI0015DA79AB|nr:hypothetical protein [Paraburkholderia sp. PGU19]